jgi:hypothetical protein
MSPFALRVHVPSGAVLALVCLAAHACSTHGSLGLHRLAGFRAERVRLRGGLLLDGDLWDGFFGVSFLGLATRRGGLVDFIDSYSSRVKTAVDGPAATPFRRVRGLVCSAGCAARAPGFAAGAPPRAPLGGAGKMERSAIITRTAAMAPCAAPKRYV